MPKICIQRRRGSEQKNTGFYHFAEVVRFKTIVSNNNTQIICQYQK